MPRQRRTQLTAGKMASTEAEAMFPLNSDGTTGYRRVALPSGTMYFMRPDVAANLKWRHLITPMWRSADGSANIVGGATVWIAALSGDDVASVAWEWATVERNVFAVANMLAIESNIYLEAPDPAGPAMKGRLLFLARLVSCLNWQEQVRRRCEEYEAAASVRSPL